MKFNKLIGSKNFYKKVFSLIIPIMVQNGITNFVNMLDNIMVGSVGTTEMTGVAITNQLIFVFNLCIFGAISGAGIFGAQYAGKGDSDGVRHTFRFKLIIGVLFSALAILFFVFCGNALISSYLKGDGSIENVIASHNAARSYMLIMLIGFIPFALSQSFSSTLRETGRSVPPMVAGVVAVGVNLAFNYLLIFGKLGCPRLGVAGAAIATVISRFVELFIMIGYTVSTKGINPFIVGAFRSLYVPLDLVKRIIVRGLPLMLNEALWASGMAVVNQCYSVRGLNVVAANNINQTFFNVFAVAYMAVGVSIGIILGQMLGAGETEKAKDAATQLTFVSIVISVVVGAAFFVCAAFIPNLYNTSSEVRRLAVGLMQICAVTMPIEAYAHALYFTLRSGGKTAITFVFDSGFIWIIHVPIAFLLSRFTGVGIFPLYLICQLLALLKSALGFYFVKKGVWANKIVD